MAKVTIGTEAREDIKHQETKKPANLPANAVPVDGFVLAVDGKLKTRYEGAEEAMAAALKLKQSYPVIQVAVYDASQQTYTAVDAKDSTGRSA